MRNKWNFSGDINLEYGGLFWREDGSVDYVLAVKVTPCSAGGGPDNLFLVETGPIYMPQETEKKRSALSCCGYDIDESGNVTDGTGATHTGKDARALLVDAWDAYHGLECYSENVIRIGKEEQCSSNDWNPEPYQIFRSDAKLKNIVKRGFLH